MSRTDSGSDTRAAWDDSCKGSESEGDTFLKTYIFFYYVASCQAPRKI